MSDLPTQLLGWLDLLGSFAILWSGWHITSSAGWFSAQERWAMARRMMYAVMAAVLFFLSMKRLIEQSERADWQTFIPHATLILYILSFPYLRYFGFVNQDRFVSDANVRRQLRMNQNGSQGRSTAS